MLQATGYERLVHRVLTMRDAINHKHWFFTLEITGLREIHERTLTVDILGEPSLNDEL